MSRRHRRVELAQQHLDRKSFVSLIEGPAVCRSLIGVGNAAIKISDSRSICECLRAGSIGRSSDKEPVTPIRETKRVFVSRA